MVGIIKIVVNKLGKLSVRLTVDECQRSGLRKNLSEWRMRHEFIFPSLSLTNFRQFLYALTFLVLFGSSQKVHNLKLISICFWIPIGVYPAASGAGMTKIYIKPFPPLRGGREGLQ